MAEAEDPNVTFLQKWVKPGGIDFVNSCIFHIKSDNFQFYLEMTMTTFVHANVNIFHKINLLRKIPKSS